MGLFAYLIKVSLCILLFYGLYFAFFRRTTFFLANRLYLCLCLLVSWVIPTLDLTAVALDSHTLSTQITNIQLPYESPLLSGQLTSIENHWVDYGWLSVVYFSGVIFFGFRLLLACVKVLFLKRTAVSLVHQRRVFKVDIDEPFTFLNWIFLPLQGVDPLVLQHEKVHVRHRHWIDLLVMEMSAIALWFNPLLVVYRKSMRIQHEYVADACVATSTSTVKIYLDIILAHLKSNMNPGPLSSFYSKHIKQRIIMMTQKRTSSVFSIAYTLTVPLFIALLFNFSSSSTDSYGDNGNRTGKVIVIDAGHGGNDLGSQHSGIREKDVVLSLAQAIRDAATRRNLNVVLTRRTDVGVSLEDRVSMAAKNNADMFISLHANSDMNDQNSSGIVCLVSESNERFDESKNVAEKLVQSLSSLKGMTINGVKQSGAYVLSKNTVPAVILEVGYLSNADDFAFVTNAANQQQLAQQILAAIED